MLLNMMSVFSQVHWAVIDTWVVTKRNLIRYLRVPQLLIFSTIQPVMFLLLFTFVFGGAIQVPGGNYINFLLPGVLIQSVIFGAIQTGIGLSDDLSKGLIDRFRSLPMVRLAVLAGRTLSDAIRNVFVVSMMLMIGAAIGFRPEGGFLATVTAGMLAVLFGFAFSWISASIGLAVKNPETAQVAGFIWVFPLVFASSAYVPIDTMPAALKAFATISPVTVTINAVRALMGGLPLENNLLYAFVWMAGILLIFIPLAVRSYKRVNS